MNFITQFKKEKVSFEHLNSKSFQILIHNSFTIIKYSQKYLHNILVNFPRNRRNSYILQLNYNVLHSSKD